VVERVAGAAGCGGACMSGGKAHRALRWSYAMTWATKAVNIVTMIVLARILGPESFGVVALALVFVLFIEMFAESGLAPAIVQRKDLSPEDLDSIFWLNIALALPLAILGYAASDLLGHLVSDEQVPGMFAALSPLILFRGLSVVQMALAQREMRFKDLALRSTCSAVLGGIAGISCALADVGIWSLVAQAIVGEVASFLLLWHLGEWRPRLRFELRRAISFFRFSSGVIVSQIAVFASNQSDVLVMGAMFGPKAVGVFRLAMRVVNILLEMLVRPVQAIALPHLSSLRDDPTSLQREVLALMRLSSLAMLPAMGALIVGAEALTSLLGARWEAAAAAMRVLAFIGVAKSMSLLTGPTMLALGRSHVVALGSIGQCAITVAAVVCAGLWAKGRSDDDQVMAVAAARAGVFLLVVMPFQLRYMSRATGIAPRKILRAVAPGAQAFVLTVVVGLAAEYGARSLGFDRMVAIWAGALAGGLVAGLLLLRTRRFLPRKKKRGKDLAAATDSSEAATPETDRGQAPTPIEPMIPEDGRA
jgi:teichuronic acid exporter